MTERTKWDAIAERRRLKKENAAIRAGGGIDQSWMKFKRCQLCGRRMCVNNYEDRRSRTPRIMGIKVCPWCEGHGGKANVRRLILVRKLIERSCLSEDAQIQDGQVIAPEGCKCLACLALKAEVKSAQELGLPSPRPSK